jgi:hypothetical protein
MSDWNAVNVMLFEATFLEGLRVNRGFGRHSSSNTAINASFTTFVLGEMNEIQS